MTWEAHLPHNDLPALPPTVEVETKRVLKSAIEARSALATLDQAVRRIPNPHVLINSIPLLESQASSEIENIVTTADELFRFAHNESDAPDPATKEAFRYRTALFFGFNSIRERPLATGTAVEICSIIHGREMSLRNLPGTFIGNPATMQAIYTPPQGEREIRDLLSNWELFVHNSTHLDPLVVMAIAHYQFEAIHPFADGNGRTGRIINVLMLVDAGLLQQPILYLSRYILENKTNYYKLLLEVTREGAWEEWILFVLEGLRQTALMTVRKIDAIHELQEEVQEHIRAVTTGGANADLLAVLFEQPYSRISSVMERCHVSRPTATMWLNALIGRGALVDIKVGRERLFINSRLLDVLRRSERL